MGKTQIIIAAHKVCEVPIDSLYLPLFLGAAIIEKEGSAIPGIPFHRDDKGENISEKNRCFGSLTGLYWAWKNLDTEYIGLVHYRRYFLEGKHIKGKAFSGIMTDNTLTMLERKYSVFVPKKRRYYFETLHSHYSNTMSPTHMDIVRGVISEKSPDYLFAFDQVMKQHWGYMFNMMILRKDLLNLYCQWLFKILFEVEKRIGHEGMTEFENRYCGRISERLFNVWLRYMLEKGKISEKEICELDYTEEVNYIRKVVDYLRARVLHERYTKSS